MSGQPRATQHVTADSLFVFAGAGLSWSPPSCLPMFDPMRDALVRGLDVATERGLVPEPFFSTLKRSGADIEGWLREVLDGEWNAAHYVVARLAHAGARVWTVNLDELIEAASGHSLDVCAWPAPARAATLYKPHGTLSGQIVVGADQVLAGLPEDWASTLGEHVAGRVAVFVGYSARDLDFRPLWRQVLSRANSVHWFVMPDDDERDYIRRVVGVPVTFWPHLPPPSGRANPSADFVSWCLSSGLVADVPPDLVAAMGGDRRPWIAPPLRAPRPIARGAVLELLSEIRAARRQYVRGLVHPRHARRAARRLVNLDLNHGGRPMAAALGAAALLPDIGPLRARKRQMLRKHTSILLNMGAQERVLDRTAGAELSDVSTDLILRAGALRYLGRLDHAAALAEEALRRAIAERHNDRAANAAFQAAISWSWAGRLNEAAASIDLVGDLARLAATRWLAWHDWLCAVLRINQGSPTTETLELLDEARARFAVEGLNDGIISALTVQLTATRQLGDPDEFRATRAALDEALRRRRSAVYYTRGHRFTAESIAFEDGEHARATGRTVDADRHFQVVAASAYPLHQALGGIGLAANANDAPARAAYADEAARVAETIRADGLVALARRVGTSAGEVGPLLIP